MAEAIDKEFLGDMADAYQNVRQHRVASLLDVAASFDGEQDGRLQQNYIDAALKLAPAEFETVLRERMDAAELPLDVRSRAALLYLRGDELKFWHASPLNRRRARKLAGHEGDASGMTKPEASHVSKLDAVTAKDSMQIYLALEKAGTQMTLRVRDPNANPVTKLEAVQEYLRVLEFLQPGAWAKYCADHPEFVAAARELACRTLQEAKHDKA